ncbi:MAG: peptide chain release factor 1 [Dehalococcoidia bacterium]|nr:peptide chain release factor 1 [Dehalococcoidia bacterium]MQG00010.1 peptide chain release factor 1 [SAR202 cluster bacterium]
MFDRLEAIVERFREIDNLLAQPDIASNHELIQELSKERSSIESIVALYDRYQDVTRQKIDADTIIKESDDDEITAMAEEERLNLVRSQNELEQHILTSLISKDPNDEKDVIVEIRAGAGGEEAALFAEDLYRMYARYAQNKSWSVDIIDGNTTGIGGFKEIVFEVRGIGAFSRLKHESGVHRVQRIPATETGGRIHTSTATVAVLPEAEEVDIEVDPNDLRIDIFHSGGHGGQNVQKVATAVRITHIPSGIVATCQDERSQLKNKQRAMGVLRARLLDVETTKKQAELAADRRSQVGTGDRSEKVRTYNYPQNRVTDHRISVTSHNLDRILAGEIDDFIDNLSAQEQAKKLQDALK